MPKLNVVLITIDSLRADFVGYKNKQEENSPFLSKLAQQSYVFPNAIAPSTNTYFCFPSLMTGTLPFQFGTCLGIPNQKEIKTIAEVLKKKGYLTAAFIANNPGLHHMYGFARGFDIYVNDIGNKNPALIQRLSSQFWKRLRQFPKLNLLTLNLLAFYRTFINPPKMPISGKELNQKIKKFLLQKSSKRPFFLWIHYMDVHYPYFSGINNNLNLNHLPIAETKAKLRFYKEHTRCVERREINDKKLIAIFKQIYRNCIKYVDSCLEQLYNFITSNYPHTVFIVTSDHGEEFMEHGRYGHQPFSLYNELIRVPLMINLPNKTSKQVKSVVSLLSLPKTICSILDIHKTRFQGTNLLQENCSADINRISIILYRCINPIVKLKIFDNKTPIEGFNKLWSYTTIDYKYIAMENGEREELYDLAKDPFEKQNLISQSKIPTAIKTVLANQMKR